VREECHSLLHPPLEVDELFEKLATVLRNTQLVLATGLSQGLRRDWWWERLQLAPLSKTDHGKS